MYTCDFCSGGGGKRAEMKRARDHVNTYRSYKRTNTNTFWRNLKSLNLAYALPRMMVHTNGNHKKLLCQPTLNPKREKLQPLHPAGNSRSLQLSSGINIRAHAASTVCFVLCCFRTNNNTLGFFSALARPTSTRKRTDARREGLEKT